MALFEAAMPPGTGIPIVDPFRAVLAPRSASRFGRLSKVPMDRAMAHAPRPASRPTLLPDQLISRQTALMENGMPTFISDRSGNNEQIAIAHQKSALDHAVELTSNTFSQHARDEFDAE